MRPPEARRDKPRVSAFTSADTEKILALEPDLVLAFSDIQADIVADLIRAGLQVHVFNHRSIAGIFDMMRMLGAIVSAEERAADLVADLKRRLTATRERATKCKRRPKVFFEEWDEPLISASKWVAELIEIAGGDYVFLDHASKKGAKERIVSASEVAATAPDIIIGSWCGKKFSPRKVAARPGFSEIPAVRDGKLYEIKSAIILQPGPAALTDGLEELQKIIGENAIA